MGYFVLDNASTNNTAVAALAIKYNFTTSHRRLRCAPHIINLVGQAILFGLDYNSYDNALEEASDEAKFLTEWRKHGPLGVLLDILTHIRSPLQYDLFAQCQQRANSELPVEQHRIFEPIKTVVTRWNSYYSTIERATHLQTAINAYANIHIDQTRTDDAYARAQKIKLPDVPAWMKSDGLLAND